MTQQINDTITVDLHDHNISSIPLIDPDELEDVLIHAAYRLTGGKEPLILEALMNTLVDFYVFTLESGDDIEDIGFLVSSIEDKVCDAIAFRRSFIDNGAYDISGTEGGLMTEEDDDDENVDLPQPIEPERFTEVVDTPEGKKTLWKIRCPKAVEEPVQERHVSDTDDVRDKEIPGMMKRFEYDGFEVTVKLVPKTEFD